MEQLQTLDLIVGIVAKTLFILLMLLIGIFILRILKEISEFKKGTTKFKNDISDSLSSSNIKNMLVSVVNGVFASVVLTKVSKFLGNIQSSVKK